MLAACSARRAPGAPPALPALRAGAALPRLVPMNVVVRGVRPAVRAGAGLLGGRDLRELRGDGGSSPSAGSSCCGRWPALDPVGQLILWVPFVLVFPLWFFRYSRSLWLGLEYGLNPEPEGR